MKDQLEALVMQMYKSGILYSEAVREFTHYRAMLHAELGLEPTLRLRRLVEGLQSQRR